MNWVDYLLLLFYVIVCEELSYGNKTPMEGVTETKFDERMDHLVIAISRDPSHDQLPNADTIAYTSKILLKGPRYSCLL